MAKNKTTKKKAKRRKPALKLLIVFDTNVLYAQVASDLVNKEVNKLIKTSSSHSDISVNWYLPSVVIDERRYQMRKKAFELLPSIQKLERLLGHNLNITEDILIQRVNDAIQSNLTELNLTVLPIETDKIDWVSLIERSSFRKPPFESGEKEKGFRDSIIAESFFQLISNTPKSPSIYRLVFVTEDNLLSEYIREKTPDAKNVRILASLKELESLINILVSKVTEEFVAEIKDKAKEYFFEKEKQGSLYYKEKIYDKIIGQYSKELFYCPAENLTRENGTWWIGNPVFLKKERQRVFWTTQITVDYKLYKYESELKFDAKPPSAGFDLSGLGVPTQSPGATFLTGFPIQPSPLSSNLIQQWNAPQKIEVGEGESKFEVNWSVNVTPTKKFTLPKIIEIKFIEHNSGKN